MGSKKPKGKATYLYAGVNSSPAAIAKGKNEHLRTLALEPAKARTSAGAKKVNSVKIEEVSRQGMFTNSTDDGTYQRLLRVQGGLGVAASAIGKEPQLAVFDVSSGLPKPKGVMDLPREAEDLDIVQTGESEYQVAFCYKYELHTVNVGKTTDEPTLAYAMPEENGMKPALRCIRYLSSEFVLAISNLPQRTGILLQVLRLPAEGHDTTRVAATALISKPVNAVAMSVANLHPLTSFDASLGNTQFIVAIAASDASVFLYTLEATTSDKITLLTKFHPLTTLRYKDKEDKVTGVAFSTFVTPKTHIRPQFLKLACTYLGAKTVEVHSIPLKKYVDKTPRNPKGPPRPTRYVVEARSTDPAVKPLLLVLTLMVLAMAVLGQALMEVYGNRPNVVYAHKWLPSWHRTLRSAEHPPAALMEEKKDQTIEFIEKLVGTDTHKVPTGSEKLVMFESEKRDEEPQVIQVDLHNEEKHAEAKSWDDLSEPQKDLWRERLNNAGYWTKDTGEKVLKGILFGELAGAVAAAAGGQ